MTKKCKMILRGLEKEKTGDLLQTKAPHKKKLLRPLFCEINGIGDLYHDLTFEKVEQSQAKIDYMKDKKLKIGKS